MRHQPLLAACVTPKFGAGHKEDSPAHQPSPRFALASSPLQICGMGFSEKVEDFLVVAIQVLQPRFRSFLVVLSVEPPVVDDVEIALKIEQQVVAGHDAAGEEVL